MVNNTVTVIIQARCGATRLPGKILLNVLDKSILQHVIERVKRAKTVKEIIVATTTMDDDKKLDAVCKKMEIKIFHGSVDDVLERFYLAAKENSAKNIVRITADCPFIDPEIIDRVVGVYFKTNVDYCSNVIEPTYPDGEDVEVFSFRLLEEAYKNTSLASDREHVTPYMYKTSSVKKVNKKNDIDLSFMRWTLDEEKDFRFIKTVLEKMYVVNPNFGMNDVINLLKKNPELGNINCGIMRNEGYSKSLREDKDI